MQDGNPWDFVFVLSDENKEKKEEEKTVKSGVDMFAEDADMFAENYNVS